MLCPLNLIAKGMTTVCDKHWFYDHKVKQQRQQHPRSPLRLPLDNRRPPGQMVSTYLHQETKASFAGHTFSRNLLFAITCMNSIYNKVGFAAL